MPVHTVNRWEDRILRTDLPCPAAEAEDYQLRPSFASFVEEEKDFLAWARQKTGWGDDCSDAHVFTRTYATLFCDVSSLPCLYCLNHPSLDKASTDSKSRAISESSRVRGTGVGECECLRRTGGWQQEDLPGDVERGEGGPAEGRSAPR